MRIMGVLALLWSACALGQAAAQGNATKGAAQAYPVRPVQVIIAYPPGGAVDVMARNLINTIQPQMNQQFVVVNRDGASGAIGFGVLANSTPDGYTLGAGPTTPMSITPHLMKNIKFGVDSFEYICQSFENVFTMEVPQESPYRTVTELLAAVKESPGKITYGSGGIGTVPQLTVTNLMWRSKLSITGVSYRGEAPMLLDLLAGRLSFDSPSVSLASGRNLRVLAVFADTRHVTFPDAPTFKELGLPSMPPGLNGLFAPKGTPPAILKRLEDACEKAVQSESFTRAAKLMHAQIAYLGSAAFRARAIEDYRYKGELIRELDL